MSLPSAVDEPVPVRPGDGAPAVGSDGLLVVKPAGGTRWTMCALLFIGTTINYLDRQVLGILAPTLQTEIGWNEAQYGRIVSAFTFAYAIGFLFVGRWLDRVGTRRGYTWAIVGWSAAAMAHALARTPMTFGLARFGLGLGESGNFPAAVKATAEWFPRRERAFATGVFNAGSNIGVIVAALMVPWLTLTFGWQEAFLVTGAIGLVFAALWWWMYRTPEEHPKVTPQELAYIRQDPAEPATERIPWGRLLAHRQTWAFAIGKFMTDAVWWYYLFWLPKYLDAEFGVKLGRLALPLIVIYLVADVGSVGGGYLQRFLSARGWNHNAARKTAMLVCALLVTPTMFAGYAGTMWMAVAFVALAAAAHQGWSANLFTLTSDLFPKRAVASVVGIGGAAGAIGGFLFQNATGEYLQASGSNYGPVFVVCGLTYVVALGIIHLLVPRLERARID
ncbi:MAG TPA: MFS transporter [Rhodothermales bacterium]|nr:MFS transporter [Rhodothermales bacterium]